MEHKKSRFCSEQTSMTQYIFESSDEEIEYRDLYNPKSAKYKPPPPEVLAIIESPDKSSNKHPQVKPSAFGSQTQPRNYISKEMTFVSNHSLLPKQMIGKVNDEFNINSIQTPGTSLNSTDNYIAPNKEVMDHHDDNSVQNPIIHSVLLFSPHTNRSSNSSTTPKSKRENDRFFHELNKKPKASNYSTDHRPADNSYDKLFEPKGSVHLISNGIQDKVPPLSKKSFESAFNNHNNRDITRSTGVAFSPKSKNMPTRNPPSLTPEKTFTAVSPSIFPRAVNSSVSNNPDDIRYSHTKQPNISFFRQKAQSQASVRQQAPQLLSEGPRSLGVNMIQSPPSTPFSALKLDNSSEQFPRNIGSSASSKQNHLSLKGNINRNDIKPEISTFDSIKDSKNRDPNTKNEFNVNTHSNAVKNMSLKPSASKVSDTELADASCIYVNTIPKPNTTKANGAERLENDLVSDSITSKNSTKSPSGPEFVVNNNIYNNMNLRTSTRKVSDTELADDSYVNYNANLKSSAAKLNNAEPAEESEIYNNINLRASTKKVSDTELADDSYIRHNQNRLSKPSPVKTKPPLSTYHSIPTMTASKKSAQGIQYRDQLSPENPPRPHSHMNSTPMILDSPKPLETVYIKDRRYHILKAIGRGGTSTVMHAFDDHRTVVAIKLVDLRKLGKSSRDDYMNEVKHLEILSNSRWIIRLIDWSHHGTHLFMVMEFGEINLGVLIQQMAGDRIDMDFIRLYWRQMLYAVEFIHKHNIVHTDLKPANFVLVKGFLKLIDFGIARQIPAEHTSVIIDEEIGTLEYMAPEALRRVQSKSNPSNAPIKLRSSCDVWSLGCILYHLIYRNTPMGHLSYYEKVHLLRQGDPIISVKLPSKISITHHNKSIVLTISAAAIDVIKGALRLDPTSRYTIAQLLCHSLLNPS